MIRAPSPEEETEQFKGEIEKEVEFRSDQSLVYVKFPSSHVQRFGKRGHSFRPFLGGGCAAHTSGRLSQELPTLRKLMDIFESLVCLQLPRPFCKEQIVLETTVTHYTFLSSLQSWVHPAALLRQGQEELLNCGFNFF